MSYVRNILVLNDVDLHVQYQFGPAFRLGSTLIEGIIIGKDARGRSKKKFRVDSVDTYTK